MTAEAGHSLLRVPFGIAPEDYRGPFVTVPAPDRSGTLLLINSGATSAELETLLEPVRLRLRNITAWGFLALAVSVFAAVWLGSIGHTVLAWAVPGIAAVLTLAGGIIFLLLSRSAMVFEQAEIIGASPDLILSPLVPGQGRRSLGAGIADHFQGIPEQTDNDIERQLRFEMAHWLRGYAEKYGTPGEKAGIVELMNAEASLKTLHSMQQDLAAA